MDCAMASSSEMICVGDEKCSQVRYAGAKCDG